MLLLVMVFSSYSWTAETLLQSSFNEVVSLLYLPLLHYLNNLMYFDYRGLEFLALVYKSWQSFQVAEGHKLLK